MCVEFVLFLRNFGTLVRATIASITWTTQKVATSGADDSRMECSTRETAKVKES